MELKTTSHAVYDTKYDLVWTPKYRKWVLREDIREEPKRIFEEISGNHGFEIDTMEVAEDHVHIFLFFSAEVQHSQSSSNAEEHKCECNFQETPRSKEGTVGWRLLGRWILCPDSGR